jgi:hypothetical protein
MPAHLRTEAYRVYQQHQYPPDPQDENLTATSYERNNRLIDQAKQAFVDTTPNE